jgi:ribonuclease Z
MTRSQGYKACTFQHAKWGAGGAGWPSGWAEIFRWKELKLCWGWISMLEAVLLGTGGMVPLPRRWLSSLLVRVAGQITLFDCGEGTQIAWRAASWSFRHLGAICISHVHADHIAGLPGLLHTVANSGRVEPVNLFGPPGIAGVVDGLRVIAPLLPFEVNVTELNSGERFALPAGCLGSIAAGEHQLPVLGFRMDLPRGRAFLPERARALAVPVDRWHELQGGKTIQVGDRTVVPDDVLGPPRPGIGLAYISDTRPTAALVELASGVDLLVCEGTYGDDADQVKAASYRHMTFREAAVLARSAGVGQMWLTHFSPSVTTPEAYVDNARQVFPATTVGHDGLSVRLTFS